MALLDGGLFGGGLAGMADDLGKPQSGDSATESFGTPFGVDEFDSFGGQLVEGQFQEIARYRVPAGTEHRWGFGTAKRPENQGYAFGQLYNANDEQLHGKISLRWENATGRETEVATEVDSKDIDTPNRYDREQQKPIPEQTDKNKARQDQYLVVEFKASTPAADIINDYEVDAAASDVRIPTTEYDVA